MFSFGIEGAGVLWNITFMTQKCTIIIFLICGLILFVGQIPGANPTIPTVFPNMFPLATGQVIRHSSIYLSIPFKIDVNLICVGILH